MEEQFWVREVVSVNNGPVRKVEVIEVVCVTVVRGNGAPDDPIRDVLQYWSTSGELLAENDPDERIRAADP